MKPQRTHEDGNAVVGFVATVGLLLLVVLTVMGIDSRGSLAKS